MVTPSFNVYCNSGTDLKASSTYTDTLITYEWTNPKGITSSGSTITPIISGLYTVKATAQSTSGTTLCGGSTVLVITPRATITGPHHTCKGTPTTLTAHVDPPGLYTYQWYKNGQPIPGETSSTLMVDTTLSSDALYHVTVNIVTGCEPVSRPFRLKITDDPNSVTITGPTSVCEGSAAKLTANVSPANGIYAYQWYRDGQLIPAEIKKTYLVDTRATGTHSYSVIINRGTTCEEKSDNFNLTVADSPFEVKISGPQSVQQNDEALLTANIIPENNHIYNYQWYTFNEPIRGATNATLSADTTIAGDYTYTVVVTDQNIGCKETSEPFSLVVNEIDKFDLSVEIRGGNQVSIKGIYLGDLFNNDRTVTLTVTTENGDILTYMTTIESDKSFNFDNITFPPGNNKISVSYAAFSSNQEIVEIPTAIQIASNGNRSIIGQVTEGEVTTNPTRKLKPLFKSIPVSRTVNLFANGNLIGRSNINSNGTFIFEFSTLKSGNYAFQATVFDEHENLIFSNILNKQVLPENNIISAISRAVRNKYCPQVSPIPSL